MRVEGLPALERRLFLKLDGVAHLHLGWSRIAPLDFKAQFTQHNESRLESQAWQALSEGHFRKIEGLQRSTKNLYRKARNV